LKDDVKKNPELAEPNLELGNYYFEKGNVEGAVPS
jgi:cytochrome c-type biogenesis protein CcmH/NrfG